jgi:hypothetical protein
VTKEKPGLFEGLPNGRDPLAAIGEIGPQRVVFGLHSTARKHVKVTEKAVAGVPLNPKHLWIRRIAHEN